MATDKRPKKEEAAAKKSFEILKEDEVYSKLEPQDFIALDHGAKLLHLQAPRSKNTIKDPLCKKTQDSSKPVLPPPNIYPFSPKNRAEIKNGMKALRPGQQDKP